MSEELSIDWLGLPATSEDDIGSFRDVIDAAADQDRITWLTEAGKRVAIIAPVEVGEFFEERMAVVTGCKRKVQFPEVTVNLAGAPRSSVAVVIAVTQAMTAAGRPRDDIRNICEAVMSCEGWQDTMEFLGHTVNVAGSEG